MSTCRRCDVPLFQKSRGRPRIYCLNCVPLFNQEAAKVKRCENLELTRESSRRYRFNNLEKARERDRERYNSDPVIVKKRAAREKRRLEIAALQPVERERLRREKNRQTYHRCKNLEKRRNQYNTPTVLEKRRRRLKGNALRAAGRGLRRLEGLEIQRLKSIESAQRWKLIERIRERIRQALKGNQKSARTVELLGCSIAEAWEHLESKFKPGMTRENHGAFWHIDHIRPCASFDLSQPEQQRQCFHFTNLQPLTIEEHKLKHATQARYD